MAVLTEERIGQLLRRSLAERGIGQDQVYVELFPTPEGVLAEVVLRDGSVLEQARDAVSNAEISLRTEHVSLLSTVRALWKIENVERIPMPSPAGTPAELVSALFRATLKSGTRLQEVWVAVTPSAQRVLRPLVTDDQAWLPLIRAFLEHKLSVGGAGYWDPIREPELEVNEDAARYLRWRPYEQLKRSVDVVFRSPGSAERFLEQFVILEKFARHVNDVLEELPGPTGSFARGERLPTNSRELYEMLLPSEKSEWWEYYLRKLGRACEDWSQLKVTFARALAARGNVHGEGKV